MAQPRGLADEKIMLACTRYMRLQVENSQEEIKKIHLPKTPTQGNGLIDYLQMRDTFGNSERAKQLRNVLVEIMEPPFVDTNNGEKIIPSGIVSHYMLKELESQLKEGALTNLGECQTWIHNTYEKVFNYIIRFEKYLNTPGATPEEEPVPPTMLPLDLFKLIAGAIRSEDPAQFVEKHHELSKSYQGEFKIEKAPAAAAAPQQGGAAEFIKTMRFSSNKAKSLERGEKIYRFFRQVQTIQDNNERARILTKVGEKLTKYVKEKGGLDEGDSKAIREAFVNVAKRK